MKFAVIRQDTNPLRDRLAEAVVRTCVGHGHEVSTPENGVQFVLNLTDTSSPSLFRRKAQSIFVFSLVTAEGPVPDLRALCYATLVRTLSNIVICAVPSGNGDGKCEVYFTTPEAGFYHLAFDPEEVYRRIIPIAGAHFAIGNRFSLDLPPRYWETSPVIEKIKVFGGELDRLGVLPAPFPLREVLSEESIQHIFSLFEMKGLSYGNMSARERIPELGDTTFWMTARGIDNLSAKTIRPRTPSKRPAMGMRPELHSKRTCVFPVSIGTCTSACVRGTMLKRAKQRQIILNMQRIKSTPASGAVLSPQPAPDTAARRKSHRIRTASGLTAAVDLRHCAHFRQASIILSPTGPHSAALSVGNHPSASTAAEGDIHK